MRLVKSANGEQRLFFCSLEHVDADERVIDHLHVLQVEGNGFAECGLVFGIDDIRAETKHALEGEGSVVF